MVSRFDTFPLAVRTSALQTLLALLPAATGSCFLLVSHAASAAPPEGCLDDSDPAACCRGGVAPLNGTDGPDVISANGTDTCYVAGAGLDRIIGSSINEELVGGAGADRLVGADGHDRLIGGQGPDRLVGGEGIDELYGQDGADRMAGGPGADFLDGGDGDDRLWGGPDSDVLYPGAGIDVVRAGGGDDVVVLRSLCETGPGEILDGGPGFDKLVLPIPNFDAFQVGDTSITAEDILTILVTDELLGVGIANFEDVVLTGAEICDATCAPADCDPDIFEFDPVAGTWPGEDLDVCYGDKVPGTNPIDGVPYSVPIVEFCPNNLRPTLATDQYNADFEVGPLPPDPSATPCEIVGTEPLGSFYIPDLAPGDPGDLNDPDAPPAPNLCDPLQPVVYVIENPDGEPPYLTVPEENARDFCEQISPSATCELCNDPQGYDCSGAPADPPSGISCSVDYTPGDPGDVSQGPAEGACPSSAPFCVKGNCQTCVQLLEQPDVEARGDNTDPIFEGARRPVSGKQEPDPQTLVQEPQLTAIALTGCSSDTVDSCCLDDQCRVGTTVLRSDGTAAARNAPVVTSPCLWEQFITNKNPAEFGLGTGGSFSDGLPIRQDENPDDVQPERWTEVKGNDRFNVALEAGAFKRANFDTSFSGGAPFQLGGGADFSLSTTIFGFERELFYVGGGAEASTCGFGIEGDVRLLGDTVQVGDEDLSVDKVREFDYCDDVVAGSGISLANDGPYAVAQQAKAQFNEQRKDINERLHDLQHLVDYYLRYGANDLSQIEPELASLHIVATQQLQQRQADYRAAVAAYEQALTDFEQNQRDAIVGALADEDPVSGGQVGGGISRTFELSNSRQLLAAEIAYPIGPFRLGIEIGAAGRYGVGLKPYIEYLVDTDDLDPHVEVGAEVAPFIGADAQAALFVGFGNQFLGVDAGIQATLELLTVMFPLGGSFELDRNTRKDLINTDGNGALLLTQSQSDWAYNSGYTIGVVVRALSGQVDLFVRATIVGFQKQWKKNIASWEGVAAKFAIAGSFRAGEDANALLAREPGVAQSGSSFNSQTFPGGLGRTNSMVSTPGIGIDEAPPGEDSTPVGPEYVAAEFGCIWSPVGGDQGCNAPKCVECGTCFDLDPDPKEQQRIWEEYEALESLADSFLPGSSKPQAYASNDQRCVSVPVRTASCDLSGGGAPPG